MIGVETAAPLPRPGAGEFLSHRRFFVESPIMRMVGRPKARVRGRRLSLYLRPDELDLLGWDDPRAAIYSLVDQLADELPEEEFYGDGEGI
jgi:hypothetical protein